MLYNLTLPEQIEEMHKQGFINHKDYLEYKKIKGQKNTLLKSFESRPLTAFEKEEEMKTLDSCYFQLVQKPGRNYYELFVLRGPKQPLVKGKDSQPVKRTVETDQIKKAWDTIDNIIKGKRGWY